MKDIKKDVLFMSGQGNHQLFFKMLKALKELLGQEIPQEYIFYDKHPEGELNNQIENYKNIKGKTIIFYQSVFTEELLMETLDIIWACKHQYGAKHIIGVFPFMWNRRQDPIMKDEDKTEKWIAKTPRPHEFLRLKKTIFFLKSAGIDEMMVITPHSSAMEIYSKEYDLKFHEIDASSIFVSKLQTFISPDENNLRRIYAPDAGSIPRAVNLARLLGCDVLFSLKKRELNKKTSIVNGDKKEVEILEKEFRDYYNFEYIYYFDSELVAGKIIIMIEDEIASGGTSNDTGILLKKSGAKSIFLCSTHPVLVPGWRYRLFDDNPYEKIIMSDTIPRGYSKSTHGKIVDVSTAELIASSLFKLLNRL